jgi:ubiquinone/menaquinone biosynthesis C-methylase UbiE
MITGGMQHHIFPKVTQPVRYKSKVVLFESNEFWQSHRWDRYLELERVPAAVQAEFLRQEKLTTSAVASLLAKGACIAVMDLACGTGRIAESVLKEDPSHKKLQMTLVDFNSQTIEIATRNLQRYENVSYITSDAYDIGRLFVGCFDVVLCLELIHHLVDLDNLFGQIAGVLKPNGILIANVFAANKYREWDRLKYGRLKSVRRRVLCSISERIYNSVPRICQRVIRRMGIARIKPLAKDELCERLGKSFKVLEMSDGYYYWFRARVLSESTGSHVRQLR